VDTPGNRRDYQSVYLRRAYRDSGTVRNETVANLSMPPQAAIAAIEATLKGHTLVPAVSSSRSRGCYDHGLPLTEGMNNRGARNPHNGRSFIRRRRAAGIRSGLPS
jgi:hypothetical protein